MRTGSRNSPQWFRRLFETVPFNSAGRVGGTDRCTHACMDTRGCNVRGGWVLVTEREMVHDSRAASYDLCRSSRCNLYRVSFYRSERSYADRLSYCPGRSRRVSGMTWVRRLAELQGGRRIRGGQSAFFEAFVTRFTILNKIDVNEAALFVSVLLEHLSQDKFFVEFYIIRDTSQLSKTDLIYFEIGFWT